MDERLQKALEFGNYTVTLNNQKKLLKEKFIDQCVFYTNGYKFKINQDFNWFYIGTLAIIVFNSGICFVGKAILLKIEMSKNN